MSTVPASLLASAPLAAASPDARAASAMGGIDPPPSSDPVPSAAPAPLESIASPEGARKVIRVFCETANERPRAVRTFVDMPLIELLGQVRAAFNLGDRHFTLELRHESQLAIDTQSMLQVSLNHWRRLGRQLPLSIRFPNTLPVAEAPITMPLLFAQIDSLDSHLQTELRHQEATAAGAKWRKAHPTVAIKIATDGAGPGESARFEAVFYLHYNMERFMADQCSCNKELVDLVEAILDDNGEFGLNLNTDQLRKCPVFDLTNGYGICDILLMLDDETFPTRYMYWGSFLYKKREFSIQEFMIYHHISCFSHDISSGGDF